MLKNVLWHINNKTFSIKITELAKIDSNPIVHLFVLYELKKIKRNWSFFLPKTFIFVCFNFYDASKSFFSNCFPPLSCMNFLSANNLFLFISKTLIALCKEKSLYGAYLVIAWSYFRFASVPNASCLLPKW